MSTVLLLCGNLQDVKSALQHCIPVCHHSHSLPILQKWLVVMRELLTCVTRAYQWMSWQMNLQQILANQLGNTHYPLVTGGWQMVAAWSLGLCDGAFLKEHEFVWLYSKQTHQSYFIKVIPPENTLEDESCHNLHYSPHLSATRKGNRFYLTFFLRSDMTPIRVRTGCRHSPSLGTPSANVSAPSATGSHKWRMKRDT